MSGTHSTNPAKHECVTTPTQLLFHHIRVSPTISQRASTISSDGNDNVLVIMVKEQHLPYLDSDHEQTPYVGFVSGVRTDLVGIHTSERRAWKGWDVVCSPSVAMTSTPIKASSETCITMFPLIFIIAHPYIVG